MSLVDEISPLPPKSVLFDGSPSQGVGQVGRVYLKGIVFRTVVVSRFSEGDGTDRYLFYGLLDLISLGIVITDVAQ